MILKIYKTIFSFGNKPKNKIILFWFFCNNNYVLEIFSFGMFYPFLQSITNNSLNENFLSFLEFFNNAIGFDLSVSLLALLIFTFAIILKNIFLFFFEFWSLTFLRDLKLDFQSKILKPILEMIMKRYPI